MNLTFAFEYQLRQFRASSTLAGKRRAVSSMANLVSTDHEALILRRCRLEVFA